MRQFLEYVSSDGLSLGFLLLSAVCLVWLALKAVVNAKRECDCPRYVLRAQSGRGLIWKTYHRVDCAEWGS